MIGKSKLKKTIKISVVFLLLIMMGCNNKDPKDIIEDKAEILSINGKEVLNQTIYYKNNDSIDYSKSQFYEISNGNCIEYHSVFDTLKTEIGVNRFIIFKTSDLLKSDFSNYESIKLDEYSFLNGHSLCIERKNALNYGVIEDVVFLKSDSIKSGEKTTRIKTIYQYINFKNPPKWVNINNYK